MQPARRVMMAACASQSAKLPRAKFSAHGEGDFSTPQILIKQGARKKMFTAFLKFRVCINLRCVYEIVRGGALSCECPADAH